MNLLTFLKGNRFSRKIFGERELKIIEKQLRGISLTQSEKNRLSRDIRPKFEFIRESACFSGEFELKKGAINKKIVEEALKVILDDLLRKRIKEVLLFGSMVENKMTIRSDIDMAVIFEQINLKEATQFRMRVAGRVDDKVDIQVFNVLPEKIKKEINKQHKILYENWR